MDKTTWQTEIDLGFYGAVGIDFSGDDGGGIATLTVWGTDDKSVRIQLDSSEVDALTRKFQTLQAMMGS